MKTWVVIPAYNEEKNIRAVVEGLKKGGFDDIIVVDDGSSDRTGKVAEEGAVVLRHLINLGQGAALKTGIEYSLRNGADLIVTFDADNQHRVKDINLMINHLQKNKLDVVLGSRFLRNDTQIPWIRKIFLKGGALVFRVLYGAKLTDSHNGLRVLTRKAAKKIRIRSEGMEHASEIVEEIVRNGLKYAEYPVRINYSGELRHGNFFHALNIFYRMLLNKFLR